MSLSIIVIFKKASICFFLLKDTSQVRMINAIKQATNGPFSYSKIECGLNDISSHFVEFSNVYNTDRRSNATQSNLVYKNV